MRNREKPHIHVLPEDDANRQIANGFLNHPAVNKGRIQVLQPAGGWLKVLQSFTDTHIPGLRRYAERLFILMIDFDGIDARLKKVQAAIPDEFLRRVFVLGARTEPENIKRAIPGISSYEKIGWALAEDCMAGTMTTWGQRELNCNIGELERMRTTVTPCLFT